MAAVCRVSTPAVYSPPVLDDALSKITHRKFDVLQRLGSGGQAKVELAVQRCTGAFVALKTSRKGCAAQTKREGQVLAKLQGYDQFPRLLDSYQTKKNKKWVLVLEVLPKDINMTFFQRPEDNDITWREGVGFTFRLLEGLCALEKEGIRHKDIKPDNVFLNRENGKVVLADLGMAATRTDGCPVPFHEIRATATRHPRFLLHLEKGADHEEDMWSFGTVVVELLTDSWQFAGDYKTSGLAVNRNVLESIVKVRGALPEDWVKASPIFSELFPDGAPKGVDQLATHVASSIQPRFSSTPAAEIGEMGDLVSQGQQYTHAIRASQAIDHVLFKRYLAANVKRDGKSDPKEVRVLHVASCEEPGNSFTVDFTKHGDARPFIRRDKADHYAVQLIGDNQKTVFEETMKIPHRAAITVRDDKVHVEAYSPLGAAKKSEREEKKDAKKE